MSSQSIKRVPLEKNALTGPVVEVTLLIAGNGLPDSTVNDGPFCEAEFHFGFSRIVINRLAGLTEKVLPAPPKPIHSNERRAEQQQCGRQRNLADTNDKVVIVAIRTSARVVEPYD